MFFVYVVPGHLQLMYIIFQFKFYLTFILFYLTFILFYLTFILFITCRLFYSQQLTKRHLRRSRSLISVLLRGETEDEDFGKAKNIKQTELLVDLREAILQVARHFQAIDPKNNKVVSILVV